MGAFDVVVLGGGTAGVHVATEVVRGGKSVALVEAGLIGGESPYLACVPSNSLLLSASKGVAWEDAVARRNEVTGGLDDSGAAGRLAAAGVTVFRGTGVVTGPGEVSVASGSGSTGSGPTASGPTSLTWDDLVIATGCEPVAPPIEGLSDIPTWTTAQGLCSPDLPRRLLVLGGGSAGCELAQIFAAFGSQVTLIEADAGLLSGEAAFAGEILAAALRRAGVEIFLGSPATKAERTPEGLTLALQDGTRIDADRLLLATGRRPRLSGLGLDVLGISVTPGQALPTDASCRVVAGVAGAAGAAGPGRVWAAGDVTGITHTHASRYQAGVVAASLLGQPREADYTAIPRCVYTTPSVYAVGEPARAGLSVARVPLSDTARGRLGGDDLGRLELYAADGVLVGAVAVGPDAANWMAEVTLAIRAKIPVTVLADVVHAFPTYGEALQAAFGELARTGPGGTEAGGTEAGGTEAGGTEAGGTEAGGTEEKGIGSLSELGLETPEDDAVEQHRELVPDYLAGEVVPVPRRDAWFGVNEADAAEQARAAGFDDDDYR
jgi:pyruvate/2-oxoglutarate dehydrogenase complex dihydrolipoamide dehydrogenase (E3) component